MQIILYCVSPVMLLMYLVLAGIGYIKNYDNELDGTLKGNKRKYYIAKYLSGVTYLLISIIMILNIMDLIETFEMWGYIFIGIIIILTIVAIIVGILKKGKIAGIILNIGVTITLVYNIYGIIACNMHPDQYSEFDRIEQLNSFNTKFEQYVSNSRSGAQVKSLLQQVIASNANECNKERIVTVEFGNEGEIITKENPTHLKNNSIYSKITADKKYSVKVLYSQEEVVNKVIINEVKVNE